MESVLITGGSGFIGSNLANHLSKSMKVTIIDDLSMGRIENLQINENVKFIEGNICDYSKLEELLSTYSFDYIFHLAAIASVADSVEHPLETNRVNFEATIHLLELVKNYQPNLKRLVFSSSASVYGNEPTIPKTELSQILPQTPYAVDKFASECYLINAYKLYNIPTAVARFFNVYGVNQNPNSPYSGVISILLDKYQAILQEKSAKFTLFGDGNQSRDFIYIDDVVQGLLLLAQSNSAVGNIFNFGTGNMTTLNELIGILDTIFQKNLPVERVAARKGDIEKSLADNKKLRLLGFTPNYTLNEGLSVYVNSLDGL